MAIGPHLCSWICGGCMKSYPTREEAELCCSAEPRSPVKDTNPKAAVGDTKVPLALCSPIAEAHWALAQFAGMNKYGAWNWRAAGVRVSTYVSAMRRHIAAYVSGEESDPVDGTHHLGNIMACAAILLEAREAGMLTDDRPPSIEIRNVYREVEEQMAVLRKQYADRNPRHYTIADTVASATLPASPKQE